MGTDAEQFVVKFVYHLQIHDFSARQNSQMVNDVNIMQHNMSFMHKSMHPIFDLTSAGS